METVSSSPFSFLMHKPRKASISSSSGTLDSSYHSSILGDSLTSTSGGARMNEGDEPLVRQLRHNGTKFASDIHDRASKIHDRTVLEVTTELAKKSIANKNSCAPRRVEDRFASHMNLHKTEDQLTQLRNERRASKAIVVEETDGEDDSLDNSLAKFWEREQRKSVRYVTCNLHHLVLVGEEDKVITYAGYQYTQAVHQNDFSVPSQTMKSCSA